MERTQAERSKRDGTYVTYDVNVEHVSHSRRHPFSSTSVGSFIRVRSLGLDPPLEERCRSVVPGKCVTKRITNGEKNHNDQSSRETN